MPKKNEPELTPKPYVESGNIEAHIIADMLRIEAISSELKAQTFMVSPFHSCPNLKLMLCCHFSTNQRA